MQKKMIEFKDVVRTYGTGEALQKAADHVNFTVDEGEFVVILTKDIVKSAADATSMLEQVGLKDHANKFPTQMSGGEQQRVSIARALAKNPRLLIGDEPTGALDSETGKLILDLLIKMSHEQKKTVVIVTHNADIAKCADKVIRMKNGKVREIVKNEHPLSVEEVEW